MGNGNKQNKKLNSTQRKALACKKSNKTSPAMRKAFGCNHDTRLIRVDS